MTVDLERSLVSIVRADPLPSPVRERVVEGSPERSLFHGYSRGAELPRIHPRPCACGGLIDPGDETEIPAAVARHGAERQHTAWRERRSW